MRRLLLGWWKHLNIWLQFQRLLQLVRHSPLRFLQLYCHNLYHWLRCHNKFRQLFDKYQISGHYRRHRYFVGWYWLYLARTISPPNSPRLPGYFRFYPPKCLNRRIRPKHTLPRWFADWKEYNRLRFRQWYFAIVWRLKCLISPPIGHLIPGYFRFYPPKCLKQNIRLKHNPHRWFAEWNEANHLRFLQWYSAIG